MFAELRGQNVLVTGGANGIGAATVEAFHRAGAQVFFCDVDETAGRQLAARLKSRAVFSAVNLEREEEIVRWIAGIRNRRRPLHVLVNNAAKDPRRTLEQTSADDWDHLMALNLRAYFLTCREAARSMKAGASIINLSSITFHIAPTAMTAYVATKGGILGFTRALARELGPRRIRVNAVSPGWVMTRRQLKQFVTAEVKDQIRTAQCIPDLLQPEEIANVILFLASSASRAMTGQELLADRGWAHS